MANICDTELKMYRENKEFTSEEVKEIEKFIYEFITYEGGVYDNSGAGEEFLSFQMETKWTLPKAEILQDMAKKFNSEIRAIGRENEYGYLGFIKVNAEGELITDESIDTA